MTFLFRHLRAWLRRDTLEAELREEMAQHREWKAANLSAEGLSDEEARRHAAIAVGNLTRHRESARAVWGFGWIDDLGQDVRYGVRVLRRSPAFAAVSIASLAIGIGATAAVFSLADAVLLRTLAVRDPGSLVILKWRSGPVMPFSSLNGYGEQSDAGLASTSFSFAAYSAFRDRATRDLDIAGFADLYQVNVVADGHAELGTAHEVSGNYFNVVGVTPALGRALGAVDDRIDAAPAAVISDSLWRRRFGASPDVVGRNIRINATPFTVVGVMPAAFHGTGQVGTDPDFYVPLMLHARLMPRDDQIMDPNNWWVLMVGRLRPGVGRDAARDVLDVLLKRAVVEARPAFAANDLPRIDLLPGGRGQVEDREEMRDPLRTMGLVTLIVLLVACTNVAGLLLARGRARLRELSVRVAIGAPRSRVVRQLLTEAVLMAMAGALLAIFVARWLSAALAPALNHDPTAVALLTATNPRVLVFAALSGCGTAILFGLLPAFRSTRIDLGSSLQDAGRDALRGPRHRALSGSLVVVQIALALLLIAGAGLLARSLSNLEHVNLGFNASNLLLFRIDPSLNGYEGARALDLYTRILDRARAAPGVDDASLASHKLISNSSAVGIAMRTGETSPAPGTADLRAFQRTHQAWNIFVDERFFATLGIRTLRGRVFTRADAHGAPVAVINRAMAKQFFGDADAVGKQFRFGSARRSTDPPIDIIGVVEDAAYTSVRADKPPTIYFFYAQHPQMRNAPTFYIRTSGPPAAVAASMREIVRDIDPNLPMAGVMTQTDQIAASLAQERLFARLAALLGGVAILLSAIGLYGLVAYGVAQRTPEIGLRMALGAPSGRVQWMILKESLVLAALGLAAGVPAAMAGTRILKSMLFGLDANDPATLAAAAAAMIVLAALAGYIPSRRAARVDPLIALRAE